MQKASFKITKAVILELIDLQLPDSFIASNGVARLSDLNAAFLILSWYPHLQCLKIGLDIMQFLRVRRFAESAKSEILRLDTLFAQSVVGMITCVRSRGVQVVARWNDFLLKSCWDARVEYDMDLTDKVREELQNSCIRQIRRVVGGREIAKRLGESMIEVFR